MSRPSLSFVLALDRRQVCLVEGFQTMVWDDVLQSFAEIK